MGAVEDLDGAVHAAQAATRDLLGVLAAHAMVPGNLDLRGVPTWPGPVAAAYVCWESRIKDIARMLARQRGTDRGTRLRGKDANALIIRAYVLGLDLGE